jgi:hypothetical protein
MQAGNEFVIFDWLSKPDWTAIGLNAQQMQSLPSCLENYEAARNIGFG